MGHGPLVQLSLRSPATTAIRLINPLRHYCCSPSLSLSLSRWDFQVYFDFFLVGLAFWVAAHVSTYKSAQ